MMKQTTSVVLAIGLVAFAGCDKKKEEGTAQKPTEGAGATTPPPPPKPEPPKTLAGAELAEKYKTCVGMVNAGKVDDFKKDCIDENLVIHDFGSGMEVKGAAALVDWFKGMKTAMPDWKLEPQLVVVSGRNVLGVNLVTGTHTGPMKTPMGEVPATNKKVGMLMFHRLAINEANKATEEWAYSDPATMMGQLGLAPKGAMPTRPAMDKGMEGAPMIFVTADNDVEKANIAAVNKSNDLINTNKYADVLAMMTPDAVVADQAAPKDDKGTKENEASMKMWLGAFPDAKITPDGTWAAADLVVQTGKFSGTHTKDLGPLKKTGKKVDLDFATIFKLKDGKASHIWRFHSGMQFAMQLGLMPAAGAPPAGAPAGGDTKAPAGDAKKPAGDTKAPAGDMKKEPEKKM